MTTRLKHQSAELGSAEQKGATGGVVVCPFDTTRNVTRIDSPGRTRNVGCFSLSSFSSKKFPPPRSAPSNGIENNIWLVRFWTRWQLIDVGVE